jgi:hypothetical protein
LIQAQSLPIIPAPKARSGAIAKAETPTRRLKQR